MNVALFGRNADTAAPLVRAAGMRIVGEPFGSAQGKPEAVISIGGDGTLMKAEFAYPGIPKILLRDSMICKKCSALPNEGVLEAVAAGRYTVEELMKLHVQANGSTMAGMNDIVIHNEDVRHAIRYSVRVNGREMGTNIIGDGIVVATPFGSSGYYRSITDSVFDVGIGLAFNNSTEQQDHAVLKSGSVIELTVDRGPVIVYADNQGASIQAGKGDSISVRLSAEKAVLWTPKPQP